MFWLLVIGGGLVGVVALIAIIGFFLPKAHVASCELNLDKPAADVFETIRRIDASTAWRRDLRGVERAPDLNGHPV
jgi:hypothetical protein